VLLALVTVAPVVASYLAFYVWRPEQFKNYGELIDVTPLSGVPAAEPQAKPPFDLEPLRGHWVILMVDSGNCVGVCKEKLWQMRQLRLTQGKDMDRVTRVWLVDDGATPPSELTKEYEGTLVVQAKGSPLMAKFPAGEGQRNHLFLVDPLGNLMMRFPKDADPSRIKKDLTHLLKVSRIG
jgi:hypothetical protein